MKALALLSRAARVTRVRSRFELHQIWVLWLPETLALAQRSHIMRMVRYVGGSRTRAARLLGIDRRSLVRQLRDMVHS